MENDFFITTIDPGNALISFQGREFLTSSKKVINALQRIQKSKKYKKNVIRQGDFEIANNYLNKLKDEVH